MVDVLGSETSAELRDTAFTYREVGATLAPDLPSGYRHLSRTVTAEEADFGEAAERLLTWQVQERAGIRVAASHRRVEEGAVVMMLLGFGPFAVRAPCRVVTVVEEPGRAGFAYGTLPGHPEIGEELFLVEQAPDGVRASVTAFSRPGTRIARLGGPVARGVQELITRRYLAALTGIR